MGPLRRISRAWRSKQEKSIRERGAALVEFALVAPLFFLVVFAGIELGFMFRSYLTLEDASRNAARVASVERSSADADVRILENIERRTEILNGELQRVIIFNPATLTGDLDSLSAQCTDPDNPTSQSGECTVYEASEIAGIIDGSATAALGYQPSERRPLDNVGIYIEYDYNYVTGFLDNLTLSSTSVEVVEANISGSAVEVS